MTASRLSLAHIKFAAAEKADMLTVVGGQPAVSGYITDVVLLMWVNAELSSLWDELVSSYEDYAIHRELIQVAAGIENYPLPKDFYKHRKVFPIEGGVRGNALRRFNVDDLGRDTSLTAILAPDLSGVRYRILGSRIWLHPAPASDGTIEIWYVPQYMPLERDAEEIQHQFPAGWEDYVAEGVAGRMLEKEESDSSPCLRRQAIALQRILRLLEDRDAGEPHQMIDSEGYMDTDWGLD